MRRGPPLAWLAALALVTAGCVTTAPSRIPLSANERIFAIDGRLLAKRGGDIVAISFAWTHGETRDELVLTTPLGQTIAELWSDASTRNIELRTADGKVTEAPDWATLTERVVGMPLPVEALGWWAQGLPRPGAPSSSERDSAHRPSMLRQDGCEIRYAYSEDTTERPSRLVLGCRDVEMRIVIDRWQA